ncbi:MAG: molybdopterin-binding protein, partial [Bacteroidota bacterium]
ADVHRLAFLRHIHEKPLEYQIRRSNVYALQAALTGRSIPTDLFHFVDDKKTITQELEKILLDFDIIILSGGVSKGKADYVPQVLEELGVKKLFHRVKQRPGKPFWLGLKDSTMVFALPGNPVSTMACFHRYVLPYLKKMLGDTSDEALYAQLSQDHRFPPDLTLYLTVRVHSQENGVLMAQPVPGHGSGDFANLIEADGFLELPQGQDIYPGGSHYRLHLFRHLQF